MNNSTINAIRILSAEAIQKANSGHPGLPLGSAPIAYALWQNHLKFNNADPKWDDRDRFILSALQTPSAWRLRKRTLRQNSTATASP